MSPVRQDTIESMKLQSHHTGTEVLYSHTKYEVQRIYVWIYVCIHSKTRAPYRRATRLKKVFKSAQNMYIMGMWR